MQLYFAPASPFYRKVWLCAQAVGLADRIERTRSMLSPVAENAQLCRHNPLGKIPTLILEDGTALYDSRVITNYLDDLSPGVLLPVTGDPARWTALRTEATADGLLDAAISIRYEGNLRPEALRWDEWIAGQDRKIDRALAALEPVAGSLAAGPALPAIAVACAAAYLDFRFAEKPWRQRHCGLAAFVDEYARRPEMIATHPAST